MTFNIPHRFLQFFDENKDVAAIKIEGKQENCILIQKKCGKNSGGGVKKVESEWFANAKFNKRSNVFL